MVGHHAVVHVHGKERQRDGEQVDHERRQQHVPIQRRILGQGAPEPVAMLDPPDFGRTRIKTEFGSCKDGVAGITRGQFIARQHSFGLTQFGENQAGRPALVLPAQQDAGFLVVEQQYSRKQGGVEIIQWFLNQLAGETGPFGCALEQRGGQAIVDQRQPVDGSLVAQCAAVGTHHHEQAFEQRVGCSGRGCKVIVGPTVGRDYVRSVRKR